MSHFDKSCSVVQGFNFDKHRQDTVGFITSLEIGGQPLDADLKTISDPLNPTSVLPGVVAVLSNYSWDTSKVSSMYFSGQISTKNRQKIAEMMMGSWANIEVKFEFVIDEYELLTKKYFKSASVDGPLLGLIEKNGKDLNIDVGESPSAEVPSPENYPFRIGIKAKSLEQRVNLAVGQQRSLTKAWGVTEE
jgi:hypothetical protein